MNGVLQIYSDSNIEKDLKQLKKNTLIKEWKGIWESYSTVNKENSLKIEFASTKKALKTETINLLRDYW